MSNKCPYCKSENTEQVTIKFGSETEQKVSLCRDCKKIFGKGQNNG